MIVRILDLLKENNMTARELTKRLCVNATTVTEWKNGRTKPSVDHVRKMAEIFGVTTDYIINGTELPVKVQTATDDVMKLVLSWPDDSKEKLLDLLSAMTEVIEKSLVKVDEKTMQADTEAEDDTATMPFSAFDGDELPSFDDFDAGLDSKN